MDTRIALIGIILESRESVDALNHLLTEFGDYIIGRMGIPYREKGIHSLQHTEQIFPAFHCIILHVSGRGGRGCVSGHGIL